MTRRNAPTAVLAAPATLAIAAAAHVESAKPKGIMDTFPGAVWTEDGGHVHQIGGTDDAEAIAAALVPGDAAVAVAGAAYRVRESGGAWWAFRL